MATVKVKDLAKAIEKELREYDQEVTDGLKREIIEIGEETARKIKASAREKFNGKKYARGWISKIVYEDPENIRVAIYNRTQSGLTQLLEYGHETRNGGQTRARPHIRPEEEKAVKKLLNRVKVIVR